MQEAFVRKALAYQRSAETNRCYSQVRNALKENCICRSPLTEGAHPRSELVELYRLFVRMSDVQLAYPLLLQAQEMLGLSHADSEQVELEVLQTPGPFSI